MKFGPLEIVIILVVIFIIFGAGKLPQLFEMFGRWKSDFKKNKQGDVEELKEASLKKTKKKAKKKQA